MDQDTKKMTRTAIYVRADTFCIWHISYLADCLKARAYLIRSVWQPWCCLQQAGQA